MEQAHWYAACMQESRLKERQSLHERNSAMATQKKSLIGTSKKASAKPAVSAKPISAKKLESLRLAANHNQTSLKLSANHNQTSLRLSANHNQILL